MKSSIKVRALTPRDAAWVKDFVLQHWGAPTMVVHGVLYTMDELPGLVALSENEEVVGLLTYTIQGQSCEIVSLDSLRPREGIGGILVQTVVQHARELGCTRLWLITTNDNLNALRFYQKRGFVLSALHRNAVEQARTLKPQIPLLGNDDIPLRDELELEMLFGSEK
ncbi:MAG TPA: GNAT family N-acetyltransferase [Ktedonobacteraceae bacterium]|nr:GNAT family N-acetyltransferase [Ktedonobacteraceae bacterium]